MAGPSGRATTTSQPFMEALAAVASLTVTRPTTRATERQTIADRRTTR